MIDTPAPAVVMTGARARVGGRVVWADVDVTIGAGQFAAVLGPNGAGKSTLLKSILGLLRLDAGDVRVLGRPAGAANRAVGYLPQRRAFDATVRLRAIDLVALGRDGHRWGVPLPWPGRQRDTRIDELIELVGATAYARRPVGELSGGEQQRILIAQALVQRPQLLLLDEPLDSLDLANQAAVSALIAKLSAIEGFAVLLVAHDVNPILPYVDSVVYLAHGRAVSGPPEAVVSTETLSALYGAPVEVLRASDGRLVVVGQPEAPAHHADRHEHP